MVIVFIQEENIHIKKGWFDMKWTKAVEYMQKGGRVTRKHWLEWDYLYIKNNVLFCDGGFEYLPYLTNTKGKWIKYKG